MLAVIFFSAAGTWWCGEQVLNKWLLNKFIIAWKTEEHWQNGQFPPLLDLGISVRGIKIELYNELPSPESDDYNSSWGNHKPCMCILSFEPELITSLFPANTSLDVCISNFLSQTFFSDFNIWQIGWFN